MSGDELESLMHDTAVAGAAALSDCIRWEREEQRADAMAAFYETAYAMLSAYEAMRQELTPGVHVAPSAN